jgi:hypothetical protein
MLLLIFFWVKMYTFHNYEFLIKVSLNSFLQKPIDMVNNDRFCTKEIQGSEPDAFVFWKLH